VPQCAAEAGAEEDEKVGLHTASYRLATTASS
jgi:hypothetical protein